MQGIFLDRNNNAVQAFCANPDFSIANASLSGTKSFKKDGTGDFPLANRIALLVTPSADCTYYFNTDTTKVKTLFAGQDNLIFVGRSNISSVTIAFPVSNTNEVQGM